MTLDANNKRDTNSDNDNKTDSDIASVLAITSEVTDEISANIAHPQKRSFDQISGQTAVCGAEATSSIDHPMTDEQPECQMETNDDANQINNPSSSSGSTDDQTVLVNPVTFKVVYAKEIYEITMDQTQTISELKDRIQSLTTVSSLLQKLCFKGILNDTKSLKESGIKDGVKVMMIGSKINDILAVSSTTKETVKEMVKESLSTKEPLCQQKQHKKILDKGKPEHSQIAWRNEDCSLPVEPLTGMLNKYGNKVRITFKLELNEVWIGTKERTQKLSMSSIKSVISEPIDGYPEYHMMAFQIGLTEASRLWFYWVPAQYVKAIKNAILNS